MFVISKFLTYSLQAAGIVFSLSRLMVLSQKIMVTLQRSFLLQELQTVFICDKVILFRQDALFLHQVSP